MLHYVIPQALAPQLQVLLELLDMPDKQQQLGLAEVHVSLASLEEVFLTVVKQVGACKAWLTCSVRNLVVHDETLPLQQPALVCQLFVFLRQPLLCSMFHRLLTFCVD